MSIINSRYNFSLVVAVKGANPNGDPLAENRPRTKIDGRGYMTTECIKRKLRNRLQDMGECIFVQSEDRIDDGLLYLNQRAESFEDFKNYDSKKATYDEKMALIALLCSKWADVRLFGQVFAFKGSSISLGIRGALTINEVVSVTPITVNDTQITKSVCGSEKDTNGSDTMGMKYTVDYNLYVVNGSINPIWGARNGVTTHDVERVKEALLTLFENDESAARPAGSMIPIKLVWWTQSLDDDYTATGKPSPEKCFNALRIIPQVDTPTCLADFEISVDEICDKAPEIIDI